MKDRQPPVFEVDNIGIIDAPNPGLRFTTKGGACFDFVFGRRVGEVKPSVAPQDSLPVD